MWCWPCPVGASWVPVFVRSNLSWFFLSCVLCSSWATLFLYALTYGCFWWDALTKLVHRISSPRMVYSCICPPSHSSRSQLNSLRFRLFSWRVSISNWGICFIVKIFSGKVVSLLLCKYRPFRLGKSVNAEGAMYPISLCSRDKYSNATSPVHMSFLTSVNSLKSKRNFTHWVWKAKAPGSIWNISLLFR